MNKYSLILILILGSFFSINNNMYACVPIYIEIASPVEYIDSDGYWKYNDKHGSSESDFLAVVTDGGPALNWVWTPGRYMVKGNPNNESYRSVLPGVHTEHLGIYNYPIVSIGNVTAYSSGGSDTVNFVYCPIRCSIQCEEYIGYRTDTDFTYTISPHFWWSYVAAYFCIKDYWGNIVYVSEISGFGGTVEWDGMSNWDYNAEEFITPFALPAGYYYAGIRIFLKNKDNVEDYYIDDFPDIPGNPSFILIEADLDADMDGDGHITYFNDSDDDLMEEDPGGYVGLNSDDDNDNGIADKDDITVNGENDLVQIMLWYGPTMYTGTVKLEKITTGSGDIAIWTNSSKGTQVTLPKTWDLSSETISTILYVEGIAASNALKDVELKLSYIDAASTTIHEDKIKLTVVKVEITSPEGSLDANPNPDSSWLSSPCYHFDFQGLKGGVTGSYVLTFSGSIAPTPALSYKWTLDSAAGTLTNDTIANPTHTAPTNAGEGILTLKAKHGTVDTGIYDTRKLIIYDDHLARDIANFGTNGFCSPSWSVTTFNVNPQPTMGHWNCHGSTWHQWNGSGGGSQGGLPPSGGDTAGTPKKVVQVSHQSGGGGSHPSLGTLNRGDIVAYYTASGDLMHSQTCTGNGTETYGANNIPLQYPGAPVINESWKWATSVAGDWANDLWLPGTGIMPVTIKVFDKPSSP